MYAFALNTQTPSHSESANLKPKGRGRTHLPFDAPSRARGQIPSAQRRPKGAPTEPGRHQELPPWVPRRLQGCGQMGTPPTPSQETPRGLFFQVPRSPVQARLPFLEPQPPGAPPCIPGPRWPAPPLLGTWLVWPGLGQARYKAASARLAAPTSLLRPYPSHQPANHQPRRSAHRRSHGW